MSSKDRASEPPTPAIAKPDAASEVSKAVRTSVADRIDSTGKAIAAVAGIGVFFFAMGYFVEWQRLKQADLPAEEILPLIPKEQVAAAGVRELFVSLVFGGLVLAILGFGMVRLVRWAHGDDGRLPHLRKLIVGHEGPVTALIVCLLTLVLVPFSKGGVTVALVVTALFYGGVVLVNRFLGEAPHYRRFPLWQLSLAVAIVAIALITARQWEFPEPRPFVVATLTNGDVVSGRYVSSDSSDVLIANGGREGHRANLIDLQRDEVRHMRLLRRRPSEPEHVSLFAKLLPLPAVVQLTCIPPECRTGNNDRIGPSSFF